MQIRYRITLVYTVIVTVILLLFSIAVYWTSLENRKSIFKQRLYSKAVSTAELLKARTIGPTLLEQINRTSPSSLSQKSINVYDFSGNETFIYNDYGTASIKVTAPILKRARAEKIYYFTFGKRDAIAIEYKKEGHDYIVIVASYDLDRRDWMRKLLMIILVCFLLSVVIVIISGYIFSLGLVQSIAKLSNTIGEISSKDLSSRLDTGNGKDELEQLAITINHLLDRLQFSFDTQRRFIDNASHELSTPLTAIYSQLDIILQKERDIDDYKKTLFSIKDDVKKLNQLIRNLLEMAKVSGSEKGIELNSVRIDELLIQMPLEMKKINPGYEVNLDFDELPDAESSSLVYGNEPLLFIAFKNLVHNACKFSKNKEATVHLEFSGKTIIAIVEDQGPGIHAEEIDYIFQPFYRGGQYNNLIPGAGLGLALTNHIIKLHKGTIEVESVIARGTRFIVTLPSELQS